ncbi:Berberine bridge enzyme-like 17 [Linum grandiflorum]
MRIIVTLLIVLSFSSPLWVTLSQAASPSSKFQTFQQCLHNNHNSSDAVLYLPTNATFTTVLNAYIRNQRFTRPTTPKPVAIVTPTDESHVIATVLCTKRAGLRIIIRSGGHDYEGLSSWSPSPSIDIDLASETAWVESGATLGELYYAIAKKSKTLAFSGPPEVLLSREGKHRNFKSKSDYVKEVIPKEALPQIWEALLKTGAASAFTQWNPYGGRMAEIPTDEIAYPHRAGYLFKVQYFIGWTEEGEEAEADHIAALTALHDTVTPYVTKEPREAFFNYRDLGNGENSVDYPDWEKAKVYGEKYFKGHFERLSKIKRQFDPENFFRDQQSIPPFPY